MKCRDVQAKDNDLATIQPDDDSGFWDENLAVNRPTTRYYHDGQSTMEEDFVRYEGGTALKTDVTRTVLGARGAEAIAFKPSGQGSYGWKYPLYDLHGNMVATFSRGTGGAYSVGGARLFDAWGNVRAGSPTGAPGQRYCASLGHVQDDESGLLYMRARYYEPGAGRFISEDPARDGGNWLSYCRNQPITLVDFTGKVSVGETTVVNAQGEAIDATNGSVLFRAKSIAESTLESKLRGAMGKSRIDGIIHKLKTMEGVDPANDLLFDFTKEVLFKVESIDAAGGKTLLCLGTLKQLVEMLQ